jgi:hypothetical protein
MKYSFPARAALDADLDRLQREHVLAIELTDLVDLVRDPEADALTRRGGPLQSGMEDLAATLSAARRLPPELTVRVTVAHDDPTGPTPGDVEAALHRHAGYQSTVVWRDAMFERSMGWRQLLPGMAIAALSWALAYVFGFLATQVEGAGIGLLLVTAMLSITIAWVASWWVVETVIFGWRPSARRAAAYDLLARARLEVVPASS